MTRKLLRFFFLYLQCIIRHFCFPSQSQFQENTSTSIWSDIESCCYHKKLTLHSYACFGHLNWLRKQSRMMMFILSSNVSLYNNIKEIIKCLILITFWLQTCYCLLSLTGVFFNFFYVVFMYTIFIQYWHSFTIQRHNCIIQ